MLFLRMWSTPIEKSKVWHRNLLDGRFDLETSQTNVEQLYKPSRGQSTCFRSTSDCACLVRRSPWHAHTPARDGSRHTQDIEILQVLA